MTFTSRRLAADIRRGKREADGEIGGRDASDRRGVRVNLVSAVCFPLALLLSSFLPRDILWEWRREVEERDAPLCEAETEWINGRSVASAKELDIEVFCARCPRKISQNLQIAHIFSLLSKSLFLHVSLHFFFFLCSNCSLQCSLFLMMLPFISSYLAPSLSPSQIGQSASGSLREGGIGGKRDISGGNL